MVYYLYEYTIIIFYHTLLLFNYNLNKCVNGFVAIKGYA